MSIKHYGLDAAEIENLKAAHLSDEEINDLNKKRAQEQMEDENQPGEEEDEIRIGKLLPGVHEAVAGYIATSPTWKNKKNDEGYIKEAFEKIKARGIQKFNEALSDAFAGVQDDTSLVYDYSEENLDELSKEIEMLVNECTDEADKKSDALEKIHSALTFSRAGISNLIG